jgi:hypothetical protein
VVQVIRLMLCIFGFDGFFDHANISDLFDEVYLCCLLEFF